MAEKCPGGCGRPRRGGTRRWCRDCFARLPYELRHAYYLAEQSTPLGVPTWLPMTLSEVRRRMEKWWAANPAPADEVDDVPAWRRHKQDGA